MGKFLDFINGSRTIPSFERGVPLKGEYPGYRTMRLTADLPFLIDREISRIIAVLLNIPENSHSAPSQHFWDALLAVRKKHLYPFAHGSHYELLPHDYRFHHGEIHEHKEFFNEIVFGRADDPLVLVSYIRPDGSSRRYYGHVHRLAEEYVRFRTEDGYRNFRWESLMRPMIVSGLGDDPVRTSRLTATYEPGHVNVLVDWRK